MNSEYTLHTTQAVAQYSSLSLHSDIAAPAGATPFSSPLWTARCLLPPHSFDLSPTAIEMGFEGFSSSKWPQLGRQIHSKSGGFSDSKRKGEAASGRKLVLLHNWWLVKADPDSHDKRLRIGGFNLKENLGIRSFSSAPIVKRQDAVTLQTVDGITVMVCGYLNKSRTLENGFSEEVCDHFLIGFPYYWEDFTSLYFSEEQDPPNGVSPPSDSYRTPAQKAPRSGNTFDAIPTEATTTKNGTCVPVESLDSAVHGTRMAAKKRRNDSSRDGGPLTRSRARLLK